MSKVLRENFQIDRPAIVRLPFTFGGRAYTKGDVFPWKKLGCPEKKAAVMFSHGKLMHHAEVATVEAEVEAESDDEPVPDDLAGKSLTELREIAEAEGAPIRRSLDDQIASILEARG